MISALIGALSAAAVAGIVYVGQSQQLRWQTTMALLAEFHTRDMMDVRRLSFDYLSRCPDPDLEAMRTIPNAPLTQTERDTIWMLISFYERLSILALGGRLADRAVIDSFGEVFLWWWEFSLKHLWEQKNTTHLYALERIHAFSEWLDRQVIEEGKQTQQRIWRESGRVDRAKLSR